MLWSQRTLGAKPEQGGERRESGRATKKRTAHREGASRPGYLCCDHDVDLGRLHILVAISEFANSTWVLSRLDVQLFIPILLIWGIIDLIIGAIALYAGVSTLRGGAFGWFMGYTFATVGII